MKKLKKKVDKMMLYVELYEQSKAKEKNIIHSVFYLTFGRYNQQKEELEFQEKVSNKIENRINTLKKEL